MKPCRFLLGCLLLLTAPVCLFAQEYRFAHVDGSDGLSHNSVTCIFKDKTGFLWIGTQSGLSRFDGNSIKAFRNDPADSTTILDNIVENLFETPDGKIGVVTWAGICLYDPKHEKFTADLSSVRSTYRVAPELITNVINDRVGNHWFILRDSGLMCYNEEKKHATLLRNNPVDTTTICSNNVTSIARNQDGSYWLVHANGVLEKILLNGLQYKVVYRNHILLKQDRLKNKSHFFYLLVDSDGDLWINLRNNNTGIYYFDLKRNKIHHIDENSIPGKLSKNIVSRIVQDNKGLIWAATDHGGINVIDKKNFSVRYVTHDPANKSSLVQNSITSLYKDNEGIIWIGTYKKGLNYYHENVIQFPLYSRQSEPSKVPYEDINCFVEDDKGNLWVGSNGGGLIYFNRQTGKFTSFKYDPHDPNSISSDVIVTLRIDHEKKLWIGTFYGGVNYYDGRKFVRYLHDPSDPKSLSSRSVWEIFEDSQKRLWIGTLDGGLNLLDRKNGTFTRYGIGGPDAMTSPYTSVITEDSQGNLWIGSANGIDILIKETGTFEHFTSKRNDSSALFSNNVFDIKEDSKGRIWVGTKGGLSIFDKTTKTFRTFTDKDGLPDNSILTILEDEQGDLWLSTARGLSHVKIGSGEKLPSLEFRNYTEADGLQGMQFNENAAFRTSRGELVFGGANGFNIFKPNQLSRNTNKPTVIFTDFQLFNKSIRPGEVIDGDQLLSSSIIQAPDIILSANQNVFSIEFSALNFFQPEKNTYKYKLEGFNNDWLFADNKSRKVTFTNLDAGDYTFRVMAANSDGIWSDSGATLRLKVLPPFWKSNLAFLVYTMIIIAALLITRKIMQQREQMKFAILQERQEALRMHELDMMKIKFFTNVSHEFRTPITLILSPIEKLLRGNLRPEEQQKLFDLIQRNARRLLNLVTQLLDFRKLEVHGIKFQPSEGDIIKFIRETVYSFSDLSDKKDVTLEFRTSVTSLDTVFDPDKLEKILFNLLSNAFKFTPGGGRVSVGIELKGMSEDKFLEICVRDTGIGIPIEKQEKIFENFFQHELPKSMSNQGSGIGLSITKEFVKIHGGTISVESEPEKGSSFIVVLPVKEIRPASVQPFSEPIKSLPKNEEQVVVISDDKPLVLLVEDNEDFRFYLKDNLKQTYNIIEAKSGEDAWKKTLTNFPDLIVSDVMMPDMNGIELCQKVKSDKRVSHIPVILLTARTTDEQRLEGLESGADDYINKPFNFEILESRIRNLILQREKLHKTLSQNAGIKPSELKITPLDEQFIKSAIEHVEKNVSNAEFSVEDLYRELGLSRSLFFRKMMSLTGKSPLEFIKTIRMQQAAQLLEKSQLTVAEVAYKVGFNNPKYFARYFKEIYHVLPSAYAAGKRRHIV
jgi:signal transduction histidine kinase/ligand-binding sensor domain-containing protein/DNA-binding response OmpR family regulator